MNCAITLYVLYVFLFSLVAAQNFFFCWRRQWLLAQMDERGRTWGCCVCEESRKTRMMLILCFLPNFNDGICSLGFVFFLDMRLDWHGMALEQWVWAIGHALSFLDAFSLIGI